MVDWNATEGNYDLEVRGIDRNGNVQTAEIMPPKPSGATGHHIIQVSVDA